MGKPQVHLDKSGIVIIKYTSSESIYLGDVEDEYTQRVAVAGKNPQLIIVHIQKLVSFDIKAQEFLVSKKHCAITKAAAIILPPSLNYLLLTKYFLEKFKPAKKSFPTELFDNEAEAIAWLKQYKEK